jgi:hypothetical protein
MLAFVPGVYIRHLLSMHYRTIAECSEKTRKYGTYSLETYSLERNRERVPTPLIV